MGSGIERIIDDLENYIDNCKYRPLSNTTIMVDKDKITEIIDELKKTTPEELKRYQKVVSNQQAILNDAKKKAQQIMDEAASKTNEMVSQNAIMQQAYQRADEIVQQAYAQAQQMLVAATNEAQSVKASAIEYLDQMLAEYENIVGQTLNITQGHYTAFYNQVSQFYETVVSNRAELYPPQIDPEDIAQFAGEDVQGNPADPNMGNTAPMGNTGSIQMGNTQPMGVPGANASDNTGDIKLDFFE